MKKHGLSGTPTYRSWQAMRQRCNCITHKQSKYYCLKGIQICERWNEYTNFLLDMGEKPGTEFTLDRINVNGNYEPLNCRWATRLEQNNNKSSTIYILVEGKNISLKEYAGKIKMSYETLLYRYKKGKRGKDLIATPDKRYKREKGDVLTLKVNGKDLTYNETAEYLGINIRTLRGRTGRGYPLEKIIAPIIK